MRLAAIVTAILVITIPVDTHAAPAASSTLTVCVTQATGAVVARAKCKKGETPLNLSAVAATAIGPQGAKGDQGPQGVKGDQGAQGAKGDAGPQGNAGLQGAKGDPGARGIVDVAGCYRKVGEWQLTNDGYAYADADCNNPGSEFMIADGFDYQPFVTLALTDRMPFTLPGDTVPTGIAIGTVSATKVYQLQAIITCCKR